MIINQSTKDDIMEVTFKLLDYCRANDWAGYDPYDALNSKIYISLPFLNYKLIRLILIQGFKRSPINLRPLFLVPKTRNPKALALFLMTFIKLKKMGLLEDETLIPLMVQRLIALRSCSQLATDNRQPATGNHALSTDNRDLSTNNSFRASNLSPSFSNDPSTASPLRPHSSNQLSPIRNPQSAIDNPYWCWGYSFPWQTRTLLVPRGAPNIVATTFVANALLDLYQLELSQKVTGNRQQETGNCEPSTGSRELVTNNDLLAMGISAAEYLANELFWETGPSVAGFSYPLPGLKTPVHNANFLGAALLCRIDRLTGGKRFQGMAVKVARYSASRQGQDGSWEYGEGSTQAWVDNFHTGYNLCALREIGANCGTEEFEPVVRKGFEFYRKNFFREDGAPKYYWNSVYPLDIHSVAQSIITLMKFKNLDPVSADLARLVFNWAVTDMWDKRGYFYYQVSPCYKNRISYMRWSQAWMLLALSTLLETDNCQPSIGNC
jgi:hypothetical protein